MDQRDLDVLRARAQGGDADAMTALGKHLVTVFGPPQYVPAGVQWIAAAAGKDHPEALALVGAFTAGGVAIAPDWARGFDLVQRAAELGWAPAQEQLRFLAGRGGDDFAAMRQAIDIDGWLEPPAPTLVHERPRILTATGVMSKAECARLIAKMQGKLGRAPIYDVKTGGETTADYRSNTRAEVTLADYDLPHVLLLARMSRLLGLRAHNFEPTNVLHYFPGEEFKPHVDYLSASHPGLADNMAALGQRIVTLLIYLNDGYEGGDTFFPRLNYGFKGGVGDALMFGNVNESGEAEPLSLHAGRPPTSGEKWVLSQWVRDRAPAMTRRVN
jgi:prolyl 4-hydroxylase